MTDGGGTKLDGSCALLAKLLEQHSEGERAHVSEVLFGAGTAPRQQRVEPEEITPLPRRRFGEPSIKVAVRRQGARPS
jgi:hypothetical protein